MSRPIDKFVLATLGFGVAVPVLYYGAQLAAVPFFPGFSILTTRPVTSGRIAPLSPGC